MTLEEEIELEHQKTVDANSRIKELKKQQVLQHVKIGAAYRAGNTIYVPRDVDVDLQYNIIRVECSSISSIVNGSCKIERSWIPSDYFFQYVFVTDKGTEEILEEARKVLESHAV